MEQKNGEMYRPASCDQIIKRVLVIINTIDAGGAETFVMKIFREISKEGYCFDFLINKTDSTFHKNEIIQLGGRIYVGYSKSKHPIKCYRFVKRIVTEQKYHTILCVSAHPASALDIIAARKGGAIKVITRSTNSTVDGRMQRILADLTRPIIIKLSDIKIAPSKEAGEWMFGEKSMRAGEVEIVQNGIDTDRYKFNDKTRHIFRKKLNLRDDEVAICHIGRFSFQKNHDFLIDIFSELHGKDTNTKLFLIGEGELKSKIERKIIEYGLKEYVSFLGVRNDIPEILMAMDMMIFPSFYEGLPNVIVEAQATGLKCLISNRISEEVLLTDIINTFSINDNISDIIQKYDELNSKNILRESYSGLMRAKGYDIKTVSSHMLNWFE